MDQPAKKPPLYAMGVTDADRARLPLYRGGVLIDCDEDFERSREIQPDEIAQQRLKNWRTRMEAHQSLRNFHDAVAQSSATKLSRTVVGH